MSETITCCNCGIDFSVPEHWLKCRRNDHKWFYCPNGHQQYFAQESTEEKAIRRAQRAEQNLAYESERADASERSARAFKGQVTKLKRRASAGVCPCCKRTFSNMVAHMKTKHPEFGKNVVELKMEAVK